jgi:DNA-binding MarR family transcriptional regulator
MFDRCLYFNTSALARQLDREWTIAFKPFDLTPPQAFMLRVVLEKPGLLQKELAEEMVISRPTATRALDALEAKGLIVRRGSDSDGRESVVFPTEEALSIKTALNDASGAVTVKLKKLLGPDVFTETVMKVKGASSALK